MHKQSALTQPMGERVMNRASSKSGLLPNQQQAHKRQDVGKAAYVHQANLHGRCACLLETAGVGP